MPRLSIGVPVRNGERYIAQALDSLLSQTFGDFEIIVSDNASTDSTADIVHSYSQRDKRIRYFRSATSIGALPNFNRTFQLASGTYFHWHCHDDLCAPTYLEKCVAVLDRDPSVILCQSRTQPIDDRGDALVYDPKIGMLSDLRGLCRIECPDQIFARDANPVRRFEEAFAHAVTNHHLLGVIRAAALRRTRLFAAYYAADRGLLIELALYGRFEEIPELLFFKREHPRNSRMITGSVQRQGWVRAERQWLGRLAKLREQAHVTASVVRSPLTVSQKARCIAFGVGFIVRRKFHAMVERFKRRAVAIGEGSRSET